MRSFTLPLTWPNGHRIVESSLRIVAANHDFSVTASAEFALTFSIRFQLEQAIEYLCTGTPMDYDEDAVLPARRSLCDLDSEGSRPVFEWSFSEHNGKPIYVSIPIQPRWSGSVM
jgi:hypothetical protein